MPKRYSIADARSNLPSIVDEAEAGEEIELKETDEDVFRAAEELGIDLSRREPAGADYD